MQSEQYIVAVRQRPSEGSDPGDLLYVPAHLASIDVPTYTWLMGLKTIVGEETKNESLEP